MFERFGSRNNWAHDTVVQIHAAPWQGAVLRRFLANEGTSLPPGVEFPLNTKLLLCSELLLSASHTSWIQEWEKVLWDSDRVWFCEVPNFTKLFAAPLSFVKWSFNSRTKILTKLSWLLWGCLSELCQQEEEGRNKEEEKKIGETEEKRETRKVDRASECNGMDFQGWTCASLPVHRKH